MNAILEFDLNKPEDRERFRRASHAEDLGGCIVEAFETVRNHQKHGDQDSIALANATIQAVRDNLSEWIAIARGE